LQHQSELGPVDYLVVEFSDGRHEFDSALASSIAELIRRDVVRVLDLLVIVKSVAGEIDVIEYEELDQPELTPVNRTLAEILAFDDITNLAMAVRPGATAGVIVWEHTAVVPVSDTTCEIGAQIVAQGRISAPAIIATLNADPPGER
jgi:hypothetical protein